MLEGLSPPVGTLKNLNEIQLWENWQSLWLTIKLTKEFDDFIKERIPGGRETADYVCNFHSQTETGFKIQQGEEAVNQAS